MDIYTSTYDGIILVMLIFSAVVFILELTRHDD